MDLRLNDGRSMPAVGLGTWPLKGVDAATAVRTAIEVGYRHIDTAMTYDNEDGVGDGIRQSGIAREQVWVTTKLNGDFQGRGKARAGIERSLESLGLDYVDLLLIHWPLPWRGEFVDTWKTFIDIREEGLARSIGVSNFKTTHLEALKTETAVLPAVNQIEMSPRIDRSTDLSYARSNGIAVVAWSPLKNVLGTPAVELVARRHGCTQAEVALGWTLCQGAGVVPKSGDRARMTDNLRAVDLMLDEKDFRTLAVLDQGLANTLDSDHRGH